MELSVLTSAETKR